MAARRVGCGDGAVRELLTMGRAIRWFSLVANPTREIVVEGGRSTEALVWGGCGFVPLKF